MKTPRDLEGRGRRDALVEPLFSGLDATGDAGSEPAEGAGERSAAWVIWSLLVLVALVSWLLS